VAPHATPAPLHTPRLIVRLVTPADLEGLQAVHADEEVTAFLPYGPWHEPADAAAWYARVEAQAESAWFFVLVDRASDHIIGLAQLFRLDVGAARVELGYVLGRAWWGQGYMTEALRGLIGLAFGALGLRRIEAEIHPDHQRSIRVMQRLGFREEGRRRERWVRQGIPYDVLCYGLLVHEAGDFGSNPFAR
jgi:RimJ/RimL family protein N-acetyltransferase